MGLTTQKRLACWAICLCLCLVNAGCNRARQAQLDALKAEQAARAAALQKRRAWRAMAQARAEPDSQLGEAPSSSSVITFETEYYTTGPQQGRPADGLFPAGAEVKILEESGSYLLVRSENGVEGYVAANAVKRPQGASSDVAKIVDGANRFAFDLYRQLSGEGGNLFFSPSSIASAFGMAHAGAEGVTKSEIGEVFHFPGQGSELHAGMKVLQGSWSGLDENQGVLLKQANRLWGQEGAEFLPPFLRVTREQYGAELARLDFALTDDARNAINAWVAEQTEDKIVQVMPKGSVSAATKLVITNAVYFKGDWTYPFDARNTRDEDFHLAPASKIKAPIMHRSGEFRHGAIDDLQVLELPYGDGSLAMIVLLPNKVDGLKELEGNLTHQNLQRWQASFGRPREVRVSLPKFKTTSQFDLVEALQHLGLKAAFDGELADFSGVTGDRSFLISAAIHKAFVNVDEKGTEAAAATAMGLKGESPIPVEFRADHPFLYLIQDQRNGAILFLGRMKSPAS